MDPLASRMFEVPGVELMKILDGKPYNCMLWGISAFLHGLPTMVPTMSITFDFFLVCFDIKKIKI
jgi:hypothetical protein